MHQNPFGGRAVLETRWGTNYSAPPDSSWIFNVEKLRKEWEWEKLGHGIQRKGEKGPIFQPSFYQCILSSYIYWCLEIFCPTKLDKNFYNAYTKLCILL